MNIPDIFNEAGISYCEAGQHHHVAEGWIGVDCPWCPQPSGHKGRFRLGIETNSGRTSCWVCGTHSLASVISEMGKMSISAAKSLLTGVKLQTLTPLHTKQVSGTLIKPKGIKPLSNLPAHKRYLEKERGFDCEILQKLWNIQGIGLSPQLQWRIFIPISLNNQETSWTTRSIGNRSRYITARHEEEKQHFKDSVYGIDLVRNTIIVTEGPTDVWNIGPGAVATYGLSYTSAQVSLIMRFPHRIICFDNSREAQKKAAQLCDSLSMFPGRTTNVRLDAEDPGSASPDEIKRLRRAFL